MALLGISLSEKIQICTFNELFGSNAECGHEATSLLDARLQMVALQEHDFEFKEVPQVFDPIQVNARSPDHI